MDFYDSQLTTVNRLRLDVLPVPELTVNEMEQIKGETFENDKFVFSAYLNVSSKILVLVDIILLIAEIGEYQAPSTLTKLCENIKFKILNKKPQNKNDKNTENMLLAPINDINFDKIAMAFSQNFPHPTDLKNLRIFYNSLKNDHTMGGFLNMEIITQFFRSIHNKYKEDSAKIIERIDELKAKAYDIQTRKTQHIFESFIQIFQEINHFKQSLTDEDLKSSKLQTYFRKKSECLSSFNLQNKKKVIEKLKFMNQVSASSDEEKRGEVSMKKIDTMEQISYSNSYKPSYYFGLEEKLPKKEEEISELDIFEENRKNIKSEMDGDNKEVEKKESKRNEFKILQSMKPRSENEGYLKDMLKISSKKNDIEKMDKKTDKVSEPVLEFQHQLKVQKEKTLYNLYHADKGFIQSASLKQKAFKIKNKIFSTKSGKNTKIVNQTTSTGMPTSRAQTSSTNTRKKNYFVDHEYILGNYFNGGLDYDILFNKTDEKFSNFSLNYQSQPTLNSSKI